MNILVKILLVVYVLIFAYYYETEQTTIYLSLFIPFMIIMNTVFFHNIFKHERYTTKWYVSIFSTIIFTSALIATLIKYSLI